MLVQKALQELDGEIDRLSRIRAIVAGLHSTFSSVPYSTAPKAGEGQAAGQQSRASLAAPASAEGTSADGTAEALPKRSYRKLRFERSSRTRRSVAPMARALGGAIPPKPVFIASGTASHILPGAPVVVVPAKSRVASAPDPQAEGLDALLREVTFRRNAQRA